MATLRRSLRIKNTPTRYGFPCESVSSEISDAINLLIDAIDILDNTEDPIDKHIRHYNLKGVKVEKITANKLQFIDDEDEEEDDYKYTNDLEFKQALLDASGDHQKWIKIVESGIKQWRK